MTEINPDQAPERGAEVQNHKPKSRKKLIAILAAGALVLGGGITAAVSISNYNAETQALCVAALDKSQAALDASQLAVKAADEALEAVKSTNLPKDAGTSTDYAKRPAVKAVEAQPAKDGKPEVKAVAARLSGAEHIAAVTDAKDAIVAPAKDTDCVDRDQAAALTKGAKSTTAQVATLEAATEALLADFGTFQKEEAARIAAEKKAEEERIAAEKAAAEAAAAEAARIAAEQAAWEAQQQQYSGGGSSSGGGGGYTGGGGNSGGSGGGGTMILPPGGGGACPEGWNCGV